MGSRLTFDEVRFAHETIDGETTIIDTVNGHLLMISGLGSFLLELVRQGTSRANLIREAGERYGGDAGERVRLFLEELANTGVLVEAQDSEAASSDPMVSEPQAADWPIGFAPPVIERYEDIAEIIAMDPIHDVAPLGWPNRKIV